MSEADRKYILFDDHQRDHLLPLTFIRPVGELRIGILTLREKWERWTGKRFSHFTQEYLREKYPPETGAVNLLINARILPGADLIAEIESLAEGEVLVKDHLFVAACINAMMMKGFDGYPPEDCRTVQSKADLVVISRPWHLFRLNGEALLSDFALITRNRKSESISRTNNLVNVGDIFVEKGAVLEYTTINASTGPVYIGPNAHIMEGSLIRGPFAMGEGAQLKMGTRIYGPTTIGPYSRGGGEITNSVITGYSNKVHDGYLGNSVIGEWCNIGAGSNTSNLKNNFGLVALWNYALGDYEDTGLQFCGLIMGDYSRCGINTMFNTGTVVGISSNIYGSGYPGNFIPSFSWGGAPGYETYRPDKAIETIQKAMQFRDYAFSETDRSIVEKVYQLTGRYRKTL
ncbi:MAG: GlmU family protein [Bacteroidales bacterium]|nr:GlmU family protein [Bacteroidales bacterium]